MKKIFCLFFLCAHFPCYAACACQEWIAQAMAHVHEALPSETVEKLWRTCNQTKKCPCTHQEISDFVFGKLKDQSC